MTKKSWTVELQETNSGSAQESEWFSRKTRRHVVEVEHSYWTTRRTIYLDGLRLPANAIRRYGIYGKGSDDLFDVNGHECLVQIRSNGIVYNYDLAVDGRSVETGNAIQPYSQVYDVAPGAEDKMPGWGWLFLLLCVAVGLVAIFVGILVPSFLLKIELTQQIKLGHVLVTGLILQSLYSIVVASKESRKDSRSRIMKCAQIVGRTGVYVFGIMATMVALFH